MGELRTTPTVRASLALSPTPPPASPCNPLPIRTKHYTGMVPVVVLPFLRINGDAFHRVILDRTPPPSRSPDGVAVRACISRQRIRTRTSRAHGRRTRQRSEGTSNSSCARTEATYRPHPPSLRALAPTFPLLVPTVLQYDLDLTLEREQLPLPYCPQFLRPPILSHSPFFM